MKPAILFNPHRLIAIAVLTSHTVLLGWSATRQSPTYNEVAHLVAGISYWRHARFDIYRVNPPLSRMIAAGFVLLSNPQTDWRRFYDWPGARPEFELGKDFVAVNGQRTPWLCTIGRWSCIPFALLGAIICMRWARELYGRPAGLIAGTLWCFCPNLLGHAQLITPDVCATALGVAAAFAFWKWLNTPTLPRALVAGFALGLAELTKFTWLILFVLWPLIWGVNRLTTRSAADLRQWRRECLQLLGGVLLTALYTINLGYGFEGSFHTLRTFKFVSHMLASIPTGTSATINQASNRFARTWLGRLPVPLPKDFVLGIDLQEKDLEHFTYPSYLRGESRVVGWWYFYLYALAIKVPLGTLLLVALGLVTYCGRPISTSQSCANIVLVAPVVTIVLLASSQTAFTSQLRYILPIFPFVFILVSRIASLCGRRVISHITLAAMIWMISSSLWIYPHSLSYFNELAGGPNGGAAHLIDSNIDWGQDLLFLRQWLERHPQARPIKLAYYGYFDPRFIGIAYSCPEFPAPTAGAPPALREGWYAISVNLLKGMEAPFPRGDGRWDVWPPESGSAFSKYRPIATAGYSIYIYHIQPDGPYLNATLEGTSKKRSD